MYILSQNPWSNPTDYDRNELVFELRNKAYGAYAIRTNYNFTLLRSLALAAFFIITLFTIPKVSQIFANGTVPALPYDTIIFEQMPLPEIPKEKEEEPEKPKEIVKKLIEPAINPNFKIADVKPKDADTLTRDKIDEMKIDLLTNLTGIRSKDGSLFPDLNGFKKGNVLPEINKITDNTIHTFTTEMPEFIGGNDKIPFFLGENIHYPSGAIRVGMDAKVWVGFVVEKDGSVSNIEILKCDEKGYGFEQEAMRVIRSMPRWKPGMQNGHPARVFFNIPISFRLM